MTDMSQICHLKQKTTNNNDGFREFANKQVLLNGNPMVNDNITLEKLENNF
jgi:hypothetical protein